MLREERWRGGAGDETGCVLGLSNPLCPKGGFKTCSFETSCSELPCPKVVGSKLSEDRGTGLG